MDNHRRIIVITIPPILAYTAIYMFLDTYLSEPVSIASKPSFIALTAFVGAVLAALIAALATTQKHSKTRELEIIKRVLSSNENKLLGEIQAFGDINQDALRHRLGWSKAKVSTALSNLDRARLIKRQRSGKTYRVTLRRF